jgi:hypothetical protein
MLTMSVPWGSMIVGKPQSKTCRSHSHLSTHASDNYSITNSRSATMGKWSDGNSRDGSAVSEVTAASGGRGMEATGRSPTCLARPAPAAAAPSPPAPEAVSAQM